MGGGGVEKLDINTRANMLKNPRYVLGGIGCLLTIHYGWRFLVYMTPKTERDANWKIITSNHH